MEKICSKCKITKDVSEFRKNRTRKDGLQRYCIICDKIQQKNWYSNNKEKVIKKTVKASQIRLEQIKVFIVDYLKDHPCVVCGESDIVVLEFDHLHSKVDTVSNLVRSKNINRVKKEIEKCQVLCANCHKRKTAKDFNWFKYVQ